MSKHRNTTGYVNPKKADVHSIGNTLVHLKKGTFIKDPRALLYQYDNLIKKLGKQYSKNFSTYDDDEDLFAYIKEAFVKLVLEYQANNGVDFPGYIVKKLPLRIKYSYISKKFLHKSRMVLLQSGDYSINDLIDMIADHGEGKVTTDKHNRVSHIQRVPKIDFAFKERIKDIEKHVKMDSLDKIIFAYFIDGFGKYSYIKRLVQSLCKQYHLHYSGQQIHAHVKSLKKRLRNYYLQVNNGSFINKRKD